MSLYNLNIYFKKTMQTNIKLKYCKILEKIVKGQKYITSNVLTQGPEESLQLVHAG